MLVLAFSAMLMAAAQGSITFPAPTANFQSIDRVTMDKINYDWFPVFIRL